MAVVKSSCVMKLTLGGDMIHLISTVFQSIVNGMFLSQHSLRKLTF